MGAAQSGEQQPSNRAAAPADDTASAPAATLTDPLFLPQEIKLEEGAPVTAAAQEAAQQPPVKQAQIPAPQSDGKLHAIADYKIGKTLGQGAYGKVKLATNFNHGQHHSVAVKVIDWNKIKDRAEGTKQLVREINTMKVLRHQNVVRLYEVIHTPAKIFMVMEYATGGDLLTYINSHARLHEEQVHKFFEGMTEGISFCHKLGVCHRDLKLENLLLDQNDQVKIADFGMACINKGGLALCSTLCGSPDYAAPEILKESAHYDGELADLWSGGVILYALLCRRLPFQAHQGDIQALFNSIKQADYVVPAHVSRRASDLLGRMLAVQPSQRATIASIKADPWMQSGGAVGHAGGRKPIKASMSMDVKLPSSKLNASKFTMAQVHELPHTIVEDQPARTAQDDIAVRVLQTVPSNSLPREHRGMGACQPPAPLLASTTADTAATAAAAPAAGR